MTADEYGRWVLTTPKPAELVRPRQSYFVCGTPRCGSWFLCGLLASTGVAGWPHEWLWRDTQANLMHAWELHGFDAYVEQVISAGTTPNGVFGAKVMWGQLPELTPFPQPRFVWLRRRDRVAQAVSFAKAIQTGHWHDWDPAPSREPVFDPGAIEALVREVGEHDRAWADWFGAQNVEPLELAFEELVSDPEAQTHRVLDFLGLRLPERAAIRPLTRSQNDGLNADWCARYRAR
jgi:trehalose 2-sulfotransferase